MKRPDLMRFAGAWLAGALLVGSGFAQTTEWFELPGDLSYDLFGRSVDGGCDVDLDGTADVLAAGYRGAGLRGRIKVFSGATGCDPSSRDRERGGGHRRFRALRR